MDRKPLGEEFTTVVGVFGAESMAEQAKQALLAAGVPEHRVTSPDADLCIVSVHAQSSFEIQRIQELLRRSGARYTEHR
jgi:hypothetical protein